MTLLQRSMKKDMSLPLCQVPPVFGTQLILMMCRMYALYFLPAAELEREGVEKDILGYICLQQTARRSIKECAWRSEAHRGGKYFQ
jgi:hypothetical protein